MNNSKTRIAGVSAPNSAQEEAIRHVDGPMLVLAGPGSGKTYVITNRIRHLIEDALVPPEEILVITFSRAAAGEMRERFDHLTGQSYPGVTFGTFHACFFHMLQHRRGYRADDILRETDALSILTELLHSIRPEYADDRQIVQEISEELLRAKCMHRDSTDVESLNYRPSSCDRETFVRIYKAYNEELKKLRKLDFEDMLLLTRELLTEDEETLSMWRRRYRYLLVDEFQDINRIQYDIVRLLTGPAGNLFAVGDDDQSIYGFRGSDPSIMQSVPKDYPRCRVIRLTVNYRSTPDIVSAADALISNNRVRYEKTHTTARPAGEPPRILRFDTVPSENEFLLGEIRRLTQSGASFGDIAVLFRTNLQMRSLRDLLSRSGVPFRIRGFLPSLYEQPQVRVVLSYIRAAHGDMSRSIILTIANRPKRYLERRFLTGPTINLTAVRDAAASAGKKYLAANVDRLIYDLGMLRRLNPYAAVHYVRKVIGYDAYVADSAGHRDDAFETLNELQETVREFATAAQLFEAVAKEADERRNRPVNDDRDRSSVSLMTFHASKGLEFPHVYICDCNETIVPHKKALLPETVEEERRLLYVAMTRAQDSLSLMYVEKRFGRDLPPSCFLGEILLPAVKLTPGTRVSHRQFGAGTVLSLDDDRLRIRFDRFLLPKTLSYRLCARSMILAILPPT
ncbi:MAG: ATP-dependent helicase [Lachnospiraceae bacterium]|nr:ATP-dependent helicase [Lachnospiraceae bacterium]